MQKFNNLSLFLFWGAIQVCLLAGLLPQGAFADEPKALTTYAGEDYQIYQQTSFSNPKWDPFVKEGFEALDRQDTQTTIEFLRRATTIGCQSPLAFFKMALAYEAIGSYYTAVQYYELAQAKLSLTHPDHRYQKNFDENYGRALYLLGRTDQALIALERASKESSNYWILKLLGNVYLEKGNVEKATGFYERILSLKDVRLLPNEQIELHTTLARLHHKQNNQDAAKRSYNKVITLDPQNTEANNYLKRFKSDDSMEKVMDILDKH